MKRARVYLLAAIVVAAICVVPTKAAWLYPGYGLYSYGYGYNPYGFGFYGFIPYGFNPYGFYFYGFNPHALRPYRYWNHGYNYNPYGYRSYDYGYGYDPYGYGPYSYYSYEYRHNPRRYGPRANEPDNFYTEDWHETDDAFSEWYDAYGHIHMDDPPLARQRSRQRPQDQAGTQVRQAPGGSGQRQEAMQSGQQQQSGRAAIPQETPISGIVQDTMQLRLSGRDQQHLFARINTEQGQSIVADLGPMNEIDRLNLSQGDHVQLNGRQVMVNGRPVLMADTVSANDQTIRVRTIPGTQTRRLEGTIANTTARRLEGGSQPAHLVATVRLETGQTVPVDLGRRQDLQGVRIETGNEVVILARPVPRGDRMILVAERLSIDGEQIDIHSPQQRQRQTSQQRAGGE